MNPLTSLLLGFSALISFSAQPLLQAKTLVVAHRGASAEAPENTLPAFQLAWEQGADAIEGDFHLTKDGHIVCIHDSNTKKYTNKKFIIRESTLAELRTLDVGSWHNPTFKHTPIPTISEVLATVPKGKKIYIEIKCGPEIIPQLIKDIQRSGLKPPQIVIISFDQAVLAHIKETAPEFSTYLLQRFKKSITGKLRPTLKQTLATLKKIKANGLSSKLSNIDQAFINSLNEAHFEHHVWVIDTPKDAERFSQWGTRSITTNKPALIRKSLKLKKAPNSPLKATL